MSRSGPKQRQRQKKNQSAKTAKTLLEKPKVRSDTKPDVPHPYFSADSEDEPAKLATTTAYQETKQRRPPVRPVRNSRGEEQQQVRQNLEARDDLARLTRAPLSMPVTIKGFQPEKLFVLAVGGFYFFVTGGALITNNFEIALPNLIADVILLTLINLLFAVVRLNRLRRSYRFALAGVQMVAWFTTVLIMPHDYTIFFTIMPFYTLVAEIQFLFRARIATITAIAYWFIFYLALSLVDEPFIKNAFPLFVLTLSVPFVFVAVVSRFVLREGKQRHELITALSRLRISEERYRLVTLRANDAIYILDAEGRFSFVNPKMCEMTGWEMKELLGQHFTSILPLEKRAPTIESYQKAEHDRRASDTIATINLVRKDNSSLIAEISSTLIFAGEELQGRVGVARDITERQTMREEMARRNRDLIALNAIIGTAGGSLELDKVLNDVVNTLVEVLGADVAGITLKEEGTRLLKVAAYKGASDMVVRAVTPGLNENHNGTGNLTRSVAENGEPILIADMSNDPRVPTATVREIGLLSFAAAPIKSRDSIIGVLSLISHQRHAFDRADLDLLVSIGSQLAVAIENARLYGTSLNQVRELMCLAEIARAINLSESLNQTLSGIAQSICNTLDYAAGAVYLLDQNLQSITSHGAFGLPERFVEDLNKAIPVWAESPDWQGSGMWRAIQTQQTVVSYVNESRTVQQDRHFVELFEKLGCKAVISVPLLQQGRVLGLISCYSREKTPPPDSELRLLTTISNQTVVAVQNARLYREQQRRADQLRAVSEIGQKIGSILSVDEVLPFMTRLLQQTFDYYLVAVFLLDQNQPDELVMYSISGSNQNRGEPTRFKLDGQGILTWVARVGIPQIVADVNKDERYLCGPNMEAVKSELSVPIRVGGEVVGVLDVESTIINGFDEIDLATMTLMAEQAGIALANARLYQAQRRRAEQLRTVNEITQKIGSILRLDDLLPYLTRLLCDNFRYDHVSIFLLDEPGDQLVLTALTDLHTEHVTDGWVGERIDLKQSSIVTRAVTTGQPLLVNNIAEWYKHELMPPYDLNGQTTAELCVPVRSGGKVVGVLDIASHQINIFDETDLATAQTLADQVGIAIENARLYTQLNRFVEQLKAANNDLEEATRHKSEFLANMSHELRTPLNAIIGFSEVLQDQLFGDLNSKQDRYVGNILTSGRHLLTLVNDVLDLSKVEAGKMELHPEPFPINEAIGDVENIVIGIANKKRLTISKLLAADLPVIMADKSKFKQILYNLLSNAVKFTPEGGSVKICSRLALDGIEVSVSDTGIGIRQEDQERIFEEFRQVDSSYSRQYQGTGLGLALSRRLVELHNGKLGVVSEIGRGSTFTFWLPLAASTNKPALLAMSSER